MEWLIKGALFAIMFIVLSTVFWRIAAEELKKAKVFFVEVESKVDIFNVPFNLEQLGKIRDALRREDEEEAAK